MLYWLHEVENYLHQLDLNAGGMSDALTALEYATRQAEPGEINNECARLGGMLSELQQKVAERQSLLDSFPNAQGIVPESLQAALDQVSHPLAKDLTTKTVRIGQELQFIHRKAVALFVGQFHLAGVTEEFLRLLSGVSAQPATYDTEGEFGTGSVIDNAA